MDTLQIAKMRLATGLLTIDPRNGDIRAWVGRRDLALPFTHIAT